MSSDIDQPRQRTVAELLAEHGGGAPTGRRRRRRADEAAAAVESDPAAAAVPAPAPSAAVAGTERPESGERAPADSAVAVASVWNSPPAPSAPAEEVRVEAPAGSEAPAAETRTVPDPPRAAGEPARTESAPAPSRNGGGSVFGAPAGNGQPVEWPTEQIPLIGGTFARDVGARDVGARDVGARDVGAGDSGNGPIGRLRRASPRWRDALDAVERSERELRDGGARDDLDDGGPPTQAAPLDLDFRAPAGLDPADFERPEVDLVKLNGRYDGRPDQRAVADDEDDDWSDEDDDGDRDRAVEHGPQPDLEPRRRLGRAAAEVADGPSWFVVLAQWIGGALGGAALWIGFRFLWRSLPVVAFAASILVTIGLVLLVRALLRNEGRRTTVFVVLVGLLLTVSPAILVLLDR